ncbi:urea-proton symporter dur3-like [Plakobranchus ocellatus]|uniref:Urea-proton symporter dur3-like n=1 Tax=Plakobranchus ocellatus TaxID=259542 RepID=A0AAV4D723_9GAST|nr:urea-proton symporter dur3-like [Plakobranchus ocellatus]
MNDLQVLTFCVDSFKLQYQVQPSLEEFEGPILCVCVFGVFSVLLALAYNTIRRRVFGDANSVDFSFDAGGRVSSTLTAVAVAAQLLWPTDLLQSATETAKVELMVDYCIDRSLPCISRFSKAVAAQLLWPTDLLQSATETAKYGISGSFWYAIPILVSLAMFSLFSFQVKTRAPGAKTYLQLIQARFGQRTHVLYCVFALLTNAMVIACLVVSGSVLFRAVVKEVSAEMVVMVMATLFGSYTFVGGLGSTFYVSYFNVVIALCVLSYFVIKMFYVPEAELPFGNFSQIYEKVAGLEGTSTSEQTVSLSFWSPPSVVRAIQGTLLCLPLVFCDQATWQNKIAAKSTQGVVGLLAASFIWFAVPTTIGTSTGLAYLAFSGSGPGDNITGTGMINVSYFGTIFDHRDYTPAPTALLNGTAGLESVDVRLVLSEEDTDNGLVTPLIANVVLGKQGGIALLIMFTMLMMSTGSREVMAVSSIIVYDIYQTYILPFRSSRKKGHCLLCARPQLGEATEAIFIDAADIYCCCPLMSDCPDCTREKEMLQQEKLETVAYLEYDCPHHGQYRAYQDSLAELNSWVLLWVALSFIPIGLLIITSGLELNWIFIYGAMMVVHIIPGIILSITWVKATSQGLAAGSISGLFCGLATNLIRATILPGGLNNFLANSADGYAVLAGCGVCLVVSLVVTVSVSLATHGIHTAEDADREWQKLRDIDNPLRPWQQCLRDGGLSSPGGRRPTYQELNKHHRSTKITTYVVALLIMAGFVLVVPACLGSLRRMTSSNVQSWLMTLHIWCLATTAAVTILIPVEELWNIFSTLNQRKAVAKDTHRTCARDASSDTEQSKGLILK